VVFLRGMPCFKSAYILFEAKTIKEKAASFDFTAD